MIALKMAKNAKTVFARYQFVSIKTAYTFSCHVINYVFELSLITCLHLLFLNTTKNIPTMTVLTTTNPTTTLQNTTFQQPQHQQLLLQQQRPRLLSLQQQPFASVALAMPQQVVQPLQPR